MNKIKTIASPIIALLLIASCYTLALIIIVSFGIEIVVTAAALGYAILRTIVAVLRRFEARS